MVRLNRQVGYNRDTYLLCRLCDRVVMIPEDEAAVVLKEDEIDILVDLGSGDATAKAWGCDLTYDYVKINGDYRT